MDYYGSNAIAYQLLKLLSAWGLLVIVCGILLIVAGWKIFAKAKEPGWAILIPFYRNYISFKMYWGNGWLFLVPIVISILTFLPLVGWVFTIVGIVIHVMTQYKKAEAFGERIGFTVGLILLEPIFNMILAFGHYEYHGIPMDGVSYRDLKSKYDELNSKHVDYEEKKQAEQKPVEYEQPAKPEAKPMEYEAPKVETEEIKPAEEKGDAGEQ